MNGMVRMWGVYVLVAGLLCGMPAAAGALSDTGQNKCYGYDGEYYYRIKPCPVAGEAFYGQDGCYRINPMSFTKIGSGGGDLPNDAASWAAVRDDRTGLVWEVKHATDGTIDHGNPNDGDNGYTWYTDQPEDFCEGDPGEENDGRNTQAFLDALNTAGYAGITNWRLPTVPEMRSIINYFGTDATPSVAMSATYFPEQQGSFYWSGECSPENARMARVMNTNAGQNNEAYKWTTKFAMAVSGPKSGESTLSANGDGTVSDPATGLMWQQQAGGGGMTWADAVSYCENLQLAGHTDWRLPNMKELASIVMLSTSEPAADSEAFPDLAGDNAGLFWSATNYRDVDNALLVDFEDGQDYYRDKNQTYVVRAVRGGGVHEPDTDADGISDVEDGCPEDPDKSAPGECGCGVAEGECTADDADGDGTPDESDGCPEDPDKTAPGECGCGVAEGTCPSETVIDGGSVVVSDLWVKAVLQVPGSPVTLKWALVGVDLTPSGDQVVSGYFYADPAEFAYGSRYNPEAFVKIYIAANGWANIAVNHVTVDDVSVSTAHHYAGAATLSGTAALTNRLVEHQYTGVAIDVDAAANGSAPTVAAADGYTVASSLWLNAVLKPAFGDVALRWREVGSDTTPSGDQVISGYFYADPGDFAYGSPFNPEVFVKIYITAGGWANIAFNHVTVDDVAVSSAHNHDGAPDMTGTASLQDRLQEHTYTGVNIP